MIYDAVIAAAGSSTRAGDNKLLRKINNSTVIERSLKTFIDDLDCQNIYVVCNLEVKEFLNNNKLDSKIKLIDGGSTRQESVMNGLKSCVND
jgi:2-C-methyl-D-erythritol 4-phosphate cytidylyltransferase